MNLVNQSVIAQHYQDKITHSITRHQQMLDISKKTLKDYIERSTRFIKWCVKSHEQAVPASPETLEKYLKYASSKTKAVSTLRVWFSAIGWLHRSAGLDEFQIPRKIHLKIRKKQKTGHAKAPQQSKPILAKDLDYLHENVNILDRKQAFTLLALMVQFDTATRISETLSFRYSDIKLEEDGAAIIKLRKQKNDQLQRGAKRYLSKTTMGLFNTIVSLHGRKGEYLINNTLGNQYTKHAFIGYIKRLLEPHGMEATSHGLRIGWCIQAYEKKVPIFDMVQYVGWASEVQLRNYLRNYCAVDVGRDVGNMLGR